jgi:hypothetical protein
VTDGRAVRLRKHHLMPESVMPKLRIFTALSLALTIAGCGTTSSEPTGDIGVRVFNGSTRMITNIKVMTGPDDEVTIAKLAGGDMSGEFRVRELHENPMVTLTVDGRTLSYHPVEGFHEGFNRSLANGSYTIDIEFAGNFESLKVSVHQPIED